MVHAHEIAPAVRVRIVAGFENPALMFGDKARHPRDDADAIGAGGGEGVKVFGMHAETGCAGVKVVDGRSECLPGRLL